MSIRKTLRVAFVTVSLVSVLLISGLAFVEAARADPSHNSMRIMMVTTETEMAQMARALGAGANEYVMKPFTKPAIIEKLTMLGLVGRSGSGKSTITRLLQGINRDYEGYVKIDGGPYTFNGTMPNNGSMSFAQCGTKTQACTITFTAVGTYSFMASTHDPIAGWTYSAPITIKVSNPPTATITASKSSIATGFNSTITANYTTDTANGDSIADTDIDIAGPKPKRWWG